MRNLSRVPSFTALLIIMIWSNVALAQMDSVIFVEEVKIKASRNKISITPSQQINAENFKQYSAFNVADAIRNFAGVNIKDYGGIGGLKTVSVRSLSANHTTVLYDGIAINDTQNGQVDLGKFILDNVEAIQLYQAQPNDMPQTARSFASASVLAIKTSNPVFDSLKNHNLVLKFTSGSFGLINPVIQWQQKFNKRWAYTFNTSLQKANGKYNYRVEGDGSEDWIERLNADIRTLQLDAGIVGGFSKYNSLNIRASYFDSERGLPGAVIFYNSSSPQRLWNKDFYIQASFKQDIGAKFKLSANTKLSENYSRYLDPEYLNQKGELDNRYTQNEFYQSFAFAYQINKIITFNYAIDAAVNTLSTNFYNYAYPDRYTLLQVLGSSIEYKKWKLVANLLNTRINEKVKVGASSPSRSVYSPTFIINYQTANEWQFRAFYKSIFRYPTFNDLYYTNFGNRNVNPEFTSQTNIGMTYSKYYNRKFSFLSLSTDVYYNHIKDKIVATPNKNLFIWSISNIGKVNIYGLDYTASLHYDINKDWQILLNGNYTFQLALDVTDPKSRIYNNQIPYTPKHTFNSNIGFKNNKWGIYYNQTYSSGRYYLSDNSPEYFVSGFLISDLSGSYDFKVKKNRFTSSLEINNLFNKSYSFIRSFPMPGTSIRISLKTTI